MSVPFPNTSSQTNHTRYYISIYATTRSCCLVAFSSPWRAVVSPKDTAGSPKVSFATRGHIMICNGNTYKHDVYARVCACECTHAHRMRTHAHACVRTRTHAYARARMRTHAHARMRTHAYACVCMRVRACASTHVYVGTRARAHAHYRAHVVSVARVQHL